jgi:hypothetical protein
MNDKSQPSPWSENLILADADYIDRVAFNLICNFERMLGRRIPQADLARWIDCVALDGGLRPRPDGHQPAAIQVALLHSASRTRMDHFAPAHFSDELNGKAFSDNLGEFAIATYTTTTLTTLDDFFAEALQAACQASEVRRIMVVPNAENDALMRRIGNILRQADAIDSDRRITLFAMQPTAAGPYRQEILGYSLMAALGISAEEINTK